MPTRENCAQLESLLEATTALIETKKLVDKVDYDIQVLKTRLGNRESEGVEGMGHGESMEVEEVGEAEGEDGRAQSVVSTRSTRSRKHVSRFLLKYPPIAESEPLSSQPRRSVSISSVDTSATVSTRAGTKRQKRS